MNLRGLLIVLPMHFSLLSVDIMSYETQCGPVCRGFAQPVPQKC